MFLQIVEFFDFINLKFTRYDTIYDNGRSVCKDNLMAGGITKASELKKMFAELGIEGEPIIVLQRFLNIFKQLHIFDEPKKDAFNQEILALPPEARGLFKTLPGGSLLQEYVNDLEQESGNMRDRTDEESIGVDYKSPNAPAAQPVAVAAVAQPMLPSGELKVVAGEAFAREMATALAGAMRSAPVQGGQAAVNNQAVVGDIIKAQSELFSNMIQSQTKAQSELLSNMVQTQTKEQSELFSTMFLSQTKEISSIISIALKESHELSTKSITDAIKIFQKENLEALKSRENERKKRREDDKKNALYDDEWEYIEVDANQYNDGQHKNLGYPFLNKNYADDINGLEKSTEIDVSEDTTYFKEGIPLKIAPNEIEDLNPPKEVPSSIEPVKTKLGKIKEEMVAFFETKEEVSEPEALSEEEKLLEKIKAEMTAVLEAKEDKLELVTEEESEESEDEFEEAKFEEDEETIIEREEEKENLPDLDELLFGDEVSAEMILAEEEAVEKEERKREQGEALKQAELRLEEMKKQEAAAIAAASAAVATATSEVKKETETEEDDSEEEWEWQEVEENENDESEKDDSEFVSYVEDENHILGTREDLASREADGDDDEWEWEYEEVDEGEETAALASSGEEEEWEWEYEEVVEDESAEEKNTESYEENEEWEWEEVEDEDGDESILHVSDSSDNNQHESSTSGSA